MWASEALQREHNYYIPGYCLPNSISLIRQVDDGSVVTPVWCGACTLNFLRLCWGRDMEITLEEEGAVTKFADSVETMIGFRCVLTPHHQNSPVGPAFTPSRTRYVPQRDCHSSLSCARSLSAGRLHRAHQITGGELPAVLRTLWELIYELRTAPNHYERGILLRATHGLRIRWAVPLLRKVRTLLATLQTSHYSVV